MANLALILGLSIPLGLLGLLLIGYLIYRMTTPSAARPATSSTRQHLEGQTLSSKAVEKDGVVVDMGFDLGLHNIPKGPSPSNDNGNNEDMAMGSSSAVVGNGATQIGPDGKHGPPPSLGLGSIFPPQTSSLTPGFPPQTPSTVSKTKDDFSDIANSVDGVQERMTNLGSMPERPKNVPSLKMDLLPPLAAHVRPPLAPLAEVSDERSLQSESTSIHNAVASQNNTHRSNYSNREADIQPDASNQPAADVDAANSGVDWRDATQIDDTPLQQQFEAFMSQLDMSSAGFLAGQGQLKKTKVKKTKSGGVGQAAASTASNITRQPDAESYQPVGDEGHSGQSASRLAPASSPRRR